MTADEHLSACFRRLEPARVAPLHHPCLPAFCAMASALGALRLVNASMRWRRGQRAAGRFAAGGGGGRMTISAAGVTGRGTSWDDAAENWLAGAREVVGWK